MPRRNLLGDIRTQIRSLENVFFNSNGPISIEKLDVDSAWYDSEYEASIRKTEFSSLVLLNEIFFYKNSAPSESYKILARLEEKLLSPDFYRDFIFDDPQHDLVTQLRCAGEILQSDLNYVKENVTESDYKRVYKMMCPEHCPPTRKEFMGEIERLIKKIDKESAKLN